MKKVHISKQRVDHTTEALDEVELAVFGKKTARFRTDVKAGAEGGPSLGCKPGSCPIPMYGIAPIDLF